MSTNYIKLAYNAAALSECSVKHGAVIYRGGAILAVACNRRVTHPVSMKWSHDPKKLTTIHAEHRSIIFARADLYNATLVSVRLNGNRCSKPCAMCAALMADAGIRYVVYYDGQQFIKSRVSAL